MKKALIHTFLAICIAFAPCLGGKVDSFDRASEIISALTSPLFWRQWDEALARWTNTAERLIDEPQWRRESLAAVQELFQYGCERFSSPEQGNNWRPLSIPRCFVRHIVGWAFTPVHEYPAIERRGQPYQDKERSSCDF